MITPFLIQMKEEKYINLQEDKVELYTEFPILGELTLLEEADEYRKMVQDANLDMLSLFFISSIKSLENERRILRLLEQGSSSILRFVIDCDNLYSQEKIETIIHEFREKVAEVRNIHYGAIVFYLRVESKASVNILEGVKDQYQDDYISIINKGNDYDIQTSIICCNWVICTEVKHIHRFYEYVEEIDYIFDLSKLIEQSKVDEIVKIIKIIKKKFKKQNVRLFPLSMNRIFLHHNLDLCCNCNHGCSVCAVDDDTVEFSCPNVIKNKRVNREECLSCSLVDLCGECNFFADHIHECLMKRLFTTYYSDLFQCKLDFE